MQPVSEQRLSKHVPEETNTHAKIEERCFRCGPRQGVILKTIKLAVQFSEVKQLVAE
jgi:ribosomal protein S14